MTSEWVGLGPFRFWDILIQKEESVERLNGAFENHHDGAKEVRVQDLPSRNPGKYSVLWMLCNDEQEEENKTDYSSASDYQSNLENLSPRNWIKVILDG